LPSSARPFRAHAAPAIPPRRRGGFAPFDFPAACGLEGYSNAERLSVERYRAASWYFYAGAVMLEALKTRAGGRWVTAIPVRRIVQAIAGQQLRDVSQQHQDGSLADRLAEADQPLRRARESR